ncbi:hypothetical protein HOY82DRAFT_642051 [Tuber indicum]|nr:hypothetical protein HOY82DRAFT_642051 [Tuber indicum]
MASTLAILGPADVCLRIGPKLCERYKEIRCTNKDLVTLGNRIKSVWRDIASQLATVQSSLEAVPDNPRVPLEKLLLQLQYLLHTSYRNLEKATERNGITVLRTIRFALFRKRFLEKDVSALEKWRDEFTSTFPTLSIPESNETVLPE